MYTTIDLCINFRFCENTARQRGIALRSFESTRNTLDFNPESLQT